MGENLADFRGGIAQALNRQTGKEIESKGGWAELGLDLTKVWSISGGYTIDMPEKADLGNGFRSRNEAWFVVNRWNVRPMLFGADYLRWKTEYVGAPEGVDNRANVYVIYNF
jgi:hypothetical protein